MNRSVIVQRDTNAWIAQAWIAWALSFGASIVGIYYLPVEIWAKAFIGIGFLFTVASSFSLSKTVRDNHEAEKIYNRVTEAKAEKLLNEFEMKDAA